MRTRLKLMIADFILQRYFSFLEWARNNNIFPHIAPLPSCTWGFVYRSSGDSYYIIINKNLTCELQQEVFMHEVGHILKDFPAMPYIIGLDMQHTEMEKEAGGFGQLLAYIR